MSSGIVQSTGFIVQGTAAPQAISLSKVCHGLLSGSEDKKIQVVVGNGGNKTIVGERVKTEQCGTFQALKQDQSDLIALCK